MPPTRRIKATITAKDRASKAFRGVALAATAMGVAAVAAGAIIGVKLARGLIKATKLAAAQELQERKLAAALQSTGQFSVELFKKLRDQAAGLQAVTDVGDETIITMQALLVQFGAAPKDVTKFAEATLDMAKTLGTDFNAAAILVSKAIGGNISSLSRYGVTIDKAAFQTRGAVVVLEALEKRFGGRARAEADTFTGSINQMDNAFGDLLEKIGDPIKDVFKEFVSLALVPLIMEMDKGVKGSKGFGRQVVVLGIALAQLGEVVLPVAAALLQFGLIVGTIVLKELISSIGVATAAFKLFGVEGGNVFTKVKESLAELLAKIDDEYIPVVTGGAAATEDLGGKVTVLSETYDTLLSRIQQVAEIGFRATASLATTGKQVETIGVTIDRSIRQIGISSALQFGRVLVNAAQGGKQAFGNFFKQLLKDIAAAIIQATILKAILSFGGGGGGGGGPFGALKGFTGFIGFSPFASTAIAGGFQGATIGPRTRDDALGSGSRMAVSIEIGPNLERMVDDINIKVKRGGVRLLASEVFSPRSTR